MLHKMQIEKKQYTETKRQGLNRYSYDEVNEFSFTTTRKLNEDGILELLAQNGINLFGFIETACQEIGYNIDQMANVFKYTAREVMC